MTTASSAPLIEAVDLVKLFGSKRAVDGISLAVNKGEVLGFLGPNGAGKSTSMKMIAGFLTPSGGIARIAGHDVAESPLEAKAALGYLPEGAPAYSDMTVSSFLAFIADVRGLEGQARQAALTDSIEAVELRSVLGQKIETLSKGFQRRVGLAQAILHRPQALILDEPTDGLDPNQKQQVRALINRLADHTAIIISTHILEEVDAVCSRALIIAEGRIVADGTPAELRARSRYANAVVARVSADRAADLTTGLLALTGVAEVERKDQAGGVELTALAKEGAHISEGVRTLMESKGVSVDQFWVDPGRLDDVFRRVTQQEAA